MRLAFSVALRAPFLRPCLHPLVLQRERVLRAAMTARLAGSASVPVPVPVADLPFLSRATAAQLDKDLMDPKVGYLLPQLMELAGQAVAHATHALYPTGAVLVAVGPGNNGGDGLVAARHLAMFGRTVAVLLPTRAKGRFPMLENLLSAHGVPMVHTTGDAPDCDVVVDALFGFSFSPRGPRGVDGEYADIIQYICALGKPIVCVDVPSGWDVDSGDTPDNISVKLPAAVVSLSAPKLCVKGGHERGEFAHYIGGRFLPRGLCQRLGFEPVEYEGADLVRRVA